MNRILILIAICMTATFAMAQPGYMNYQGRLILSNGSPLPPGQHTVEVNIYDSPNAGNLVWGPFLFDGLDGVDGHADFIGVMADGRFNVIMGPKDTTGRELATAFEDRTDSARFIEMKVNKGAPILPRQQLLSAPFAYHADVANRLPDVYDDLASGNVGVGIDAPTAKLDVNGKVVIRDDLDVAGDVGITGNMVVTENLTVNGNLQMGSSLKIGARTIAVNGDGELAIDGVVNFTNGGYIKNFAVSRQDEHTRQGEDFDQTLGVDWEDYELTGVDPEHWFCALQKFAFTTGGSIGLEDTQRSRHGADVKVKDGKWVVSMTSSNQSETKAIVGCFKFR